SSRSRWQRLPVPAGSPPPRAPLSLVSDQLSAAFGRFAANRRRLTQSGSRPPLRSRRSSGFANVAALRSPPRPGRSAPRGQFWNGSRRRRSGLEALLAAGTGRVPRAARVPKDQELSRLRRSPFPAPFFESPRVNQSKIPAIYTTHRHIGNSKM